MRKIKRFRYTTVVLKTHLQIRDDRGLYFNTATGATETLMGNWCWFQNQKRGL